MDTQYRHVSIRKIDVSAFRFRRAAESDCPELISEPTVFRVGETPIAAYFRIAPRRLELLREALISIKYNKSERTNGLVTQSRIFGYSPRIAVRNLPCRLVSLANESPEHHKNICETGKVAWEMYQAINPTLAGRHEVMTREKVLDQWKIDGSAFTSGIVNYNNPLLYHFDSGNYKNVWSAMFVLKSGVTGGHLSVPELGVRFECGDCSLLMFDGQSLLHGVTPIVCNKPNAYRYSVVYYSLLSMWSCETIDDELAKMRASRTKIERRNLGGRPKAK